MAGRGAMRVVLCSNAFKGCLGAKEASEAMRDGVAMASPEATCVVVPLADGGDSTLEVLVGQKGGKYVTARVQDPLLRPVDAQYGLIDGGRTAVIEMAKASGLALLKDAERDPLRATTVGTGQLMRDALDNGATKLVLCIGGSATNDGGTGAAHALGYRFYGAGGEELAPLGLSGRLRELTRIDAAGVDPRVRAAEVVVACDVTNPLCGERGATAVYGPQKGVGTPAAHAVLDGGLDHLSRLWRAQLPGVPPDLAQRPGAGAAGGLGGGAVAFFGATFRRGFDLVSDLVGLPAALRGASLAITGEGRIDEQTGSGKVPHGVAVRCAELGVPLAGIFGSIQRPELIRKVPQLGDAALFSLCPGPMSLAQAMDPAAARRLLTQQAFMVARLFLAGRRARM